MKPLAWLAPEIPSVSGTFVYRELLAVEETTGRTVLPYSLREVPEAAIASDGARLASRVRIVYGSIPGVARGVLTHALRHPIATAATLGLALRDFAFGETTSRHTILPQAVAALSLATELRRENVEHLHVHFAHAVATLGMYAAHAAGIPFSVTAHANDIYTKQELLREKLVRARPFVTISEANTKYLRRLLGRDAEAAKIVRCGVDTRNFRPVAGDEPGGILAVGRLVPKKGFDVLLDALGRMKDPPHCRIIGDGPEREPLEALAAEAGVQDHVRFLGAVPSEKVHEELRAAGAFVLPCRPDPNGDVDGIPVALMEAMAAGVPVVSTRLSGIPELIEDRETGRLVTPEDPGALAAAIESVVCPGEFVETLIANARRKVLREYDARFNALRLAELAQIESAPFVPRNEASQDETETPSNRLSRALPAISGEGSDLARAVRRRPA